MTPEPAQSRSRIECAYTRVCRALAAAKISDLEMQRRTGISAKSIKNFRSGEYLPKTIENLIAVERALGLTVPDSPDGEAA